MFTMPTHVAFDRVGDVEISTVNLEDMSAGRVRWETCVFRANGDSQVTGRYTSLESALRGHDRAIYEVTAGG